MNGQIHGVFVSQEVTIVLLLKLLKMKKKITFRNFNYEV